MRTATSMGPRARATGATSVPANEVPIRERRRRGRGSRGGSWRSEGRSTRSLRRREPRRDCGRDRLLACRVGRRRLGRGRWLGRRRLVSLLVTMLISGRSLLGGGRGAGFARRRGGDDEAQYDENADDRPDDHASRGTAAPSRWNGMRPGRCVVTRLSYCWLPGWVSRWKVRLRRREVWRLPARGGGRWRDCNGRRRGRHREGDVFALLVGHPDRRPHRSRPEAFSAYSAAIAHSAIGAKFVDRHNGEAGRPQLRGRGRGSGLL